MESENRNIELECLVKAKELIELSIINMTKEKCNVKIEENKAGHLLTSKQISKRFFYISQSTAHNIASYFGIEPVRINDSRLPSYDYVEIFKFILKNKTRGLYPRMIEASQNNDDLKNILKKIKLDLSIPKQSSPN